ncbi:MAG: transketolase, partial [Melioribacteraceae bacterium]|nr:transketolase [Melioribacteraceae bacterium]
DDIKNFRQSESITPGHPEYGMTPGVETTTGPLEQGFGNAVGMSVAYHHLAAKFNKPGLQLFDHNIYAIVSDGDLMEGVSHETASFAGHNKLSNLIIFYDNNRITIDGSTDLAFSENIEMRFKAYGWNVLTIDDVNDLTQNRNAVTEAQNEKEKPTLIITNTVIGYGSPSKHNTAGVHGSPLGDEEIKLTKENFDWNYNESFFIPDEVREDFKSVVQKGKDSQSKWNDLLKRYSEEYPNEAELLNNLINGNFGTEWKDHLPGFENYGEKLATRSASGKVLNAIAEYLPSLIGGSADLAPSNNTMLNNYEAFSAGNHSGRNFHFGIREHAMGSILNGMSLYGLVIPYGGTFLIFSDYMRPAIRLASLSKLNPIYVFTHDSIGLGEDGPTHQPVEHLASLRAIPGCVVLRPADANETTYAWQAALEHKGGPVALILTRQKLVTIDRNKYAPATETLKGAYILRDTETDPDAIIISTGSEVTLCLEAAEKLASENINVRVVSMPSWELFENQNEQYKKSVLPNNVKARVSVEAGVSFGWQKYIGDKGKAISIEKFGASAPANILMDKYGFSIDNVIAKVREVIAE